MWNRPLFVILCIATTLSFCPQQLTGQDKQAEFKSVDTDSDGKVSTEELKAYLNDKYVEAWAKKIDANGNGKISKWEFRLIGKALQRILEESKSAPAVATGPANEPPESSTAMMNGFYLKRPPLVGATVDDVVGLDEEGKEVDFEEFRGKHVVVVFGCLT